MSLSSGIFRVFHLIRFDEPCLLTMVLSCRIWLFNWKYLIRMLNHFFSFSVWLFYVGVKRLSESTKLEMFFWIQLEKKWSNPRPSTHNSQNFIAYTQQPPTLSRTTHAHQHVLDDTSPHARCAKSPILVVFKGTSCQNTCHPATRVTTVIITTVITLTNFPAFSPLEWHCVFPP
jgi:hypothetical protein